jgi:hypothetical protein
MTHDEAEDTLVRELCVARGLTFTPWEIHPADVHDGPSPWPPGCAGHTSWPLAQRLRRRLLDQAAREERAR